MLLGVEAVLAAPHLVEVVGAPELAGHEEEVEEGRGDFEGQGPVVPEGAEEPLKRCVSRCVFGIARGGSWKSGQTYHGYDGLGQCPEEGGDHGELEDAGEKLVLLRIDAVENDADVWEEFGDNIKGAYDGQRYLISIMCRYIPHTKHSANSHAESFSLV